jgi:hypothetical protein
MLSVKTEVKPYKRLPGARVQNANIETKLRGGHISREDLFLMIKMVTYFKFLSKLPSDLTL